MKEIHGDRGLRILTSNSLDELLDRLAAVMRREPLPPLTAETVVVQSQGMARWLSLELARRHGVSASLRMPFPAAFCRTLTGGSGTPDRFETDALTFRLFRLFGGAAQDPRLAEAARYLTEDRDQRKRHQLARRVAACFDDYQLYRDELLMAWDKERGAEGPARWQAHLWRRLLREVMPPPPEPTAEREQALLPFPETTDRQSPYRYQEVRELLADPARAVEHLPPRVSVFGASTLPPVFVALLEQMGAHVPVRLYLMRPDREPSFGGHPLTVAFGSQIRDFTEVLAQHAPSAVREDLPLRDPGRDCLLHVLQSDVLTGRTPERRTPLRDDDESLRVHACHSPMREMEVLRDQVLAALEADQTLQPHDVLVLVPDIAVYAPYIEAAFRNAEMPLPFRVADRGLQAEEPLVAAFLRVLDLAQGRLTAAEVLNLLEVEALRARFGIQRSQLPILRAWVERTRIRWGVDGEDRRQHFRVPGLEEHSWRYGLRRLVLGHATGPTEDLVAGIAPSGERTDANAELLGAFSEFCETVFARFRGLARPHGLGRWRDLLHRILDDLFLPTGDDDYAGLEMARAAVARLGELEELSDLAEEVTPAVVREHLQHAFRAASHPHVFLGGGITFAALKPMRTIPVRMLCLAGMQDEAFPRRDRPPPFDLIALDPRPGDRSARADDRQLFLECLLAARDRLVITYVGRSQKDDSERPPAIVLTELLEYLEHTCEPSAGTSAEQALTVVHPLQAFGRRYFDGSDPRLFSYAARNCPRPTEVCDELFAPEPIPVAEAEVLEDIELDDLVRFWLDPSKWFCRQVMGLWLPKLDDREDDAEPFALHGLDQYLLQQQFCEALVAGEVEGRPYEVLLQQGLLPAGELGRILHARAMTEAEAFVTHMPFTPGGDRREAVVTGEGWTLHGTVDGLTDTERVVWRYAKRKPKDRLRAWIHHLFLNAASRKDPELPRRTVQIARDEEVTWKETDDPWPHLDLLIRGFRRGQREPLTFFEQSSFAFARQQYDREKKGRRGGANPWQAAEDAWHANESKRTGSDEENPHAVLCARDRDLFRSKSSAFAHWAQNVWLPVLREDDRK